MIREGTKVEWDWSGSTATGKVKEVFREDVTRTIKGNEVSKEASEDEPAYLIEQEDGDEALKSSSEVRRADD